MDNSGWLNLFLSIIAICISIYAVYNSYEQNRLTETLNYLTIDPEIVSYFGYPDFNYSISENPRIVVKNNGSIRAVSLGVKHNLYFFDKISNTIFNGASIKDSYKDIGGDYMIFESILNPKNYVSKPLLKSTENDNPQNKYESHYVLAYLFDIDYYRESDMKHYNIRDIYFVDNGKVYKNKNFISSGYYLPIIEGIDSFQFSKNQNFPF